MHSTTFFVALASVASAAMHDVAVGAGGKLVYDPATVMAAEGDIIRFNWPSSIGHNVVSSDYDSTTPRLIFVARAFANRTCRSLPAQWQHRLSHHE